VHQLRDEVARHGRDCSCDPIRTVQGEDLPEQALTFSRAHTEIRVDLYPNFRLTVRVHTFPHAESQKCMNASCDCYTSAFV
jgi:hypothetical protein